MLSTVTTKGQVTIPKKIRDAMRIRPSDRVEFMQNGEIITIVPVRTLREFRGAVRKLGVGGFEKERKKAKTSVGRRVIEEMQ
ncbi:MAG: AbrB/MazE/SpoVT family DNA-binding domain-containing protein [Deltaproteobacteria bacterium]|nr:AbrB/MazE/SpoVT family DNA-binding domain-containing protein [Deltaproteobacteria bacterium]